MRRHREGPPHEKTQGRTPEVFPIVLNKSKQNFLFYARHKLESGVSIKQVEAAQEMTLALLCAFLPEPREVR